MRHNVLKKQSTKPERVVYEVIKNLRIPFRHRWIIKGREVDFVIGNICIEINGHEQDPEKNRMLVEQGYTPIHFSNKEILEDKNKIKNQIKQLWQNQHDLHK